MVSDPEARPTQVERRAAALAAALFESDSLPPVLLALWHERWFPTALELPESVQRLHEIRSSRIDALEPLLRDPVVGEAFSQLFPCIDVFADNGRESGRAYLGFYRGARRERSLDDSPVIRIAADGGMQVVARSLFEHLLLAASDETEWRMHRAQARASWPEALRALLRNAGVPLPAFDEAAARKRARTAGPHPLEDLAETLSHVPLTASPTLQAMVSRAEALVREKPRRRKVLVIELHRRPWKRGSLTRAGGPSVGVSEAKRSALALERKQAAHFLTLDLEAFPLLREAPSVGPKTRALAFFVEVPSTGEEAGLERLQHVLSGKNGVGVSEGALGKAESAALPPSADPEVARATPLGVEVELPESVFVEDEETVRQRVRLALQHARPAEAGAIADDAMDARLALWPSADGVGLVSLSLREPNPAKRFFGALRVALRDAGCEVPFSDDQEDESLVRWMREVEAQLEAQKEAPDTAAEVPGRAAHAALIAAWSRPTAHALAALLTHPEASVRYWAALSIAEVHAATGNWDMYAGVFERFRDRLSGELTDCQTSVAAAPVLIQAFPKPVDLGQVDWAALSDEEADALLNAGTSAQEERIVAALERLALEPEVAAQQAVVEFFVERVAQKDFSANILETLVLRAQRDPEGLFRAQTERLRERMLGFLRDATASTYHRSHAAEVLGKLGDRRAIEPARALLPATQGFDRVRLIDALRLLEAREAVPDLLATLTLDAIPPDPRGDDAGRALAYARDAALRAVLELGGPEERAQARADLRARPGLLAASGVRYVEQALAREALAGDADARRLLVELLEQGVFHHTGAEALARLQATEAIPFLIAAMRRASARSDFDERFQHEHAVKALAAIRDARVVPGLIEALENPSALDSADVKTVVNALAALGDPRAIPALAAHAGQGELWTRQAAAVAIQRIAPGSSEGADRIVELLETPPSGYSPGHQRDLMLLLTELARERKPARTETTERFRRAFLAARERLAAREDVEGAIAAAEAALAAWSEEA